MNQDLKQYDCIAVLCGGLRKHDGIYVPTTFKDGDEFGMLGGHVRVMAAAELYRQGITDTFVFSTGVSAKQIAKFGPDVPPEAHVYRDAFKQMIDMPHGADASPRLYVEDKSINTVANLQEIARLCDKQGWRNVALLSSEYHIPRIRALYELLESRAALKPFAIDFVQAETVLRKYRPGEYDKEFAKQYATPAARLRIMNEHQGLADIQEGRYVLSEYQLAQQ
jgi:uncharacterized SAM-binding protein YcdF (DUF218 family)